MGSKAPSPRRIYLKWPWNVIVYIVLAVVLRIFAVPLILLIMWWNKKQQSDGPEEGYCLQRTRGRLAGLILAGLFIAGGGLAVWFFMMAQSMPYEAEQLQEDLSFGYYLIPVLGFGAILVGLFLAYQSLRDALYPEKSALAQSIRDQLPYPDEAPPVRELFAMVDRDLRENGVWFGKLGVGREWVLGDKVSRIPRIRGVFHRIERNTRHAGERTVVTRLYEVWIVDDRQRLQVTSLRSREELEGAIDCLRQRAPAAMSGGYGSREYSDLVYAREEQQYAQERAYRKRTAQAEAQARQEQERQAQNQVLTLPDGSVTSRITPEDLRQLLLRPDRTGETSPFQLVPGIPFQGAQHTFSRLACLPGGAGEPARILLEEYPGTPGSARPVRLDPGPLHRRGGDGAAGLAAGGSALAGRLDPNGALRPYLAPLGWNKRRSLFCAAPTPSGRAVDPEHRRSPAAQPRLEGHGISAAGADPGSGQLPDPGTEGPGKSEKLLVYPVRRGPAGPGSGLLFRRDRDLQPGRGPPVGTDGARCPESHSALLRRLQSQEGRCL